MSRLTTQLESTITALRVADPLLPVHVVVPSHLLGAWLAPRLFAERGHLGVHFLELHELAWTVAAPGALAEGRGRVPQNVDLALLLSESVEATAAETTPAYLRDAAQMAGFAPAALGTLQALSSAGVGPEALEARAGDSADPERLRLLARLARGLAARLDAEGLLDRAALYREAALRLPGPGIGAVVLTHLDDLQPVEVDFLEAVKAHHPVSVVAERRPPAVAPRHDARQDAVRTRLGMSPGDVDAEASETDLDRVRRTLFDRAGRAAAGGEAGAGGSPPPLRLDGTVRVLAAAGESLEAVEIARLIQKAIGEGLTHADIAVLLHDPRAYAAHLASAFERAGIDAYFVEGHPRVDEAARALWLLLGLVGGDLDRQAVMELFTTARIPWDDLLGEEAEKSASRWDRLSAEAGIVSGRASWHAHLERVRKEQQARGEAGERTVKLCDSLLQAIDRLAADLDGFPETAGWDVSLDHTLEVLDRWIVGGRLTRERLERVLRPLAEHAPPPTREEFLARVRELLESQVYREGSLADGRVLVSSIAAARGMSFRLVIVPGLVERRFPAPARPDPLLLDEEREALHPSLRTTRDAVEEERLLFLAATCAAEERLVLSYPRFETATGRERVPSSFLLEAVEAAAGQRVSAAELARLADPGATGLGRPHPAEADDALDLVERDLALVANGHRGAARHLIEDAATVRRALALEAAQWEPRLTSYDGLISVADGVEALEKLRLAGRFSSVSVVEAFAACPYKHLLGRGFWLKPWENPERAYSIEGRHWGSLYHDSVKALFERLKEKGWLPVPAERFPEIEGELAAIVEQEARKLVDEGVIVNEALLEPSRASVRAELVELLEREAREDHDGLVPTDFERGYEGLEIEFAPGRTVTFRGILDRIDVGEAPRRIRVIDYKTGYFGWKDGEQFQGGRALQLAIYNRAAQALYTDHEVLEAQYYHAVAKQKFKRKACPATPEVGEILERVLKTLDETAEKGVFAPVADTCDFCDFVGVCGSQKEARAERKQGDPRLAEFLKLREIP